MKTSLALLLASFLAAPLLYAQGSGAVNSPTALFPGERPDALPTQPAPSTSAEGLPLIPNLPPMPSGPPPVDNTAQDAGKKKNKKPAGPSRTEAAEDAMQQHIKLRAAKTKALQDPVILAELAKVNATKSDYERREVYKRYYVLLYARMTQIDPSIANGIATREATSLIRNYQMRVTPTVPKDQIGQAKPTGPENAVVGAGGGGTPPPLKGFGQARIGSY